FFFSSRRRHTRFSRHWSSDVCSSDLPLLERKALADTQVTNARRDLNQARALLANDERAQGNWAQMAGTTLLSDAPSAEGQLLNRSEERRVGKECRFRGES